MSSRIAVVTGGNKGIGFAIVRAMCKQFQGDVFLTSRNEKLGQDAIKALKKEGLNPKYHQLDIEDLNSITKIHDFFKANYGGVDVLINNAGFAYKVKDTAPFEVQAKETIRINYTGTLNVTKAFLPIIKDNGRVVIVSSGSAVSAFKKCSPELKAKFAAEDLSEENLFSLLNDFINAAQNKSVVNSGFPETAYGMSKLGLTALTKILAKEVKNGILLNCCCPGWVKTDMAGDRAPLTPDQGAETPVYLAMLPPGNTQPQGEHVYLKKVVQWKNM